MNTGRQPRGFTLLEIAVCAAMLAVLLSILAASYLAAQRHARRLDDRAVAMRTLENLMETVTAGAWASIDDARIGALDLPEAVRNRWPDAKLAGRVIATDDPESAKQVTLTLTRDGAPPMRPLTLTTWIYQAPGAP
jgi:prepilin-type N-terminal cleavage/methylation domain-containing protein